MELMSVAEAGRVLRTSRRSVMRLIEQGDLISSKEGGPHAGQHRISIESFNEYLARCAGPISLNIANPTHLYTLREVHEMTGFALRTLERDCRSGKVAHVHRGRARFMTDEQIELLIKSHVKEPENHVADMDVDTKRRLTRLMRRSQ